MQFFTWEIKNKVQGIFHSQPGLNVDGSEVFSYSDLSPITLRRRKSLKFVDSVLQQ